MYHHMQIYLNSVCRYTFSNRTFLYFQNDFHLHTHNQERKIINFYFILIINKQLRTMHQSTTRAVLLIPHHSFISSILSTCSGTITPTKQTISYFFITSEPKKNNNNIFFIQFICLFIKILNIYLSYLIKPHKLFYMCEALPNYAGSTA